jgi:hypothetical protein
VATSSIYLGPYEHEARAAFKRALAAGLSVTRAHVIAQVASFKDGWAFRSTLAEIAACSIRTVARAFAHAKREGLLRTHRAKKREIPPGCDQPLRCGWSHRFVIGWGAAGAAVKQAVEVARARWLVNHVTKPPAPAPSSPAPKRSGGVYVFRAGDKPRRTWTADELAAELDKLERERKPPD